MSNSAECCKAEIFHWSTARPDSASLGWTCEEAASFSCDIGALLRLLITGVITFDIEELMMIFAEAPEVLHQIGADWKFKYSGFSDWNMILGVIGRMLWNDGSEEAIGVVLVIATCYCLFGILVVGFFINDVGWFCAGCFACRLPWTWGFLAESNRLSGRVSSSIGRLQLNCLRWRARFYWTMYQPAVLELEFLWVHLRLGSSYLVRYSSHNFVSNFWHEYSSQ